MEVFHTISQTEHKQRLPSPKHASTKQRTCFSSLRFLQQALSTPFLPAQPQQRPPGLQWGWFCPHYSPIAADGSVPTAAGHMGLASSTKQGANHFYCVVLRYPQRHPQNQTGPFSPRQFPLGPTATSLCHVPTGAELQHCTRFPTRNKQEPPTVAPILYLRCIS